MILFLLLFQVEALVGRIERIRHSPLNINISESVDDMLSCIRRLQASRKDEISGFKARNKTVNVNRTSDFTGNYSNNLLESCRLY